MTKPTTPAAALPSGDRLVVPCEFKVADAEAGIVEGFASVFGNVDHQRDIVHRGAFTKTVAERVPRGLVKMFDTHQWTITSTLGTLIEAEEGERGGKAGLLFRGQLSSAPDVQNARIKMAEGHIDRASIGFDPVRVTWSEEEDGLIRHLHEVKLWEVSPVPIAANEECAIRLVAKGVVRCNALEARPVPWAPDEASARVRDWAKSFDKARGARVVNVARFRKAFVLEGDDPRDVTAYRLQIADVVDGALVVVPGAVKAAAVALATRGVVGPPEQMAAAREHVAHYLDQFGLPVPWRVGRSIEILAAKALAGCSDEGDEQAVSDAIGRTCTDEAKAIARAVTAGREPTDTEADEPTGESPKYHPRAVEALALQAKAALGFTTDEE